MIWLAVMRAGVVISLAAAIMQIYDSKVREVKPNRIYSTRETARYLGMDRRAVVELLKSKKLRGKFVDGNYRTPGSSILEYLNS